VPGGAVRSVGLCVLVTVLLSAVGLTGCIHEDPKVSCQIGTFALSLVVTAVNDGRTSDDVSDFVTSQGGSNLLSSACEQFAASLSTNPDQQFSFELELPSGGTEDQSVFGEYLLAPPPEPPSSSLIDCLNWDGAFLVELCFDGVIPPPAR
jgi:hypothetical protein